MSERVIVSVERQINGEKHVSSHAIDGNTLASAVLGEAEMLAALLALCRNALNATERGDVLREPK